jgi:hypothetical protein
MASADSRLDTELDGKTARDGITVLLLLVPGPRPAMEN